MTGPLYRLGGFCARHAVVVFGIWILIAIGISLGATATGRPTSDDTTIPGSDSTAATDLLEQKLPSQANGSVPIVVEATTGKLTEGANQTAVQNTVKELKANQYVRSLVNPLSKQGKSSLAEHQTLGIISLNLTLGSGDLDDEAAESVFDATAPASDAGLEVSAGGYLGGQLSSPSTRLSEIVGIVAAMIVLVFVLGTVMSMVMPIATALVGVFSGLGLIGVLGAALVVPSIAPTLAIMLGLGVGVDYSLFIVSRYRALFDGGMDYKEAVARAVATSGGAVLFAGSTVVISLLCLFFGGIPQVQELGYSAAIAVAVVIVASLTMLPAGLSLLGPRINALRVRRHVPEEGEIDPDHPNGWARWAQGIGRHPLIAAVAGILVLLVLALPVTQINLGAQDNGQMPTSTTIRQSYDALTKGFGVGYNGPLLVAVDVKPPAQNDQKSLNQLNAQEQQQQQQAQQQTEQLTEQYTEQLVDEGVPQDQAQEQAQQEATQQVEAQGPSQSQQQQTQQQKDFLKSPESDPRLVKLQKKISKAPDVDAVSDATLNNAGTAAAFSAIPKSAPSAERTQALVEVLRDEVIPKALKGTQMIAYVGGTTAGNIDLAKKIGEELPLVILIIVGLSYLLLTLAFRTMVVPALAAAMNLLAVAAAYGILVAIFQKGWGVELLGLDHAVPIVSFVPLMMFAILFGLSTDYTVFLLTRVSEENELHGDHRRAIVSGLGRAIRVIIAAASIMILVFSSFIISGDPTVKQFGVGLAAAVAVDAIIVTLVLPALMLLVGKATWYLPGPIERHMPRLGIEGDEYFKNRDAESGSAGPAPEPEGPEPAEPEPEPRPAA
ncbi:MAG: MMPL family transporter [Solirubrobacterales bacterium]